MVMKSLFLFVFCFIVSLSAQNIILQPIAKNSDQKSPFYTAKISRSGDLLGLSGADKSIKILDPATLSEKYILENKNFKSYTIAFSNDGKNIISSTPDGQISVWEFGNPIPVAAFSHGSSVRSIDIDAAGRVVSGGYDKIIKIWDSKTGKEIGRFREINAEISILSFSIDGSIVIAGCTDGSVVIGDAQKFEIIKTLSDNKSQVTSLACSNDGKYFAVSFMDSTVSLLNTQFGTAAVTLKNPTGIVRSTAFHPNNRLLITASSVLSFWDIATATTAATFSDTGFVPFVISVSKENSILAVTGRTGELRTYKILDRKLDDQPPIISMINPSNSEIKPVQLYGNQFEISGIISDENAIREVTLNGKPLPTTVASNQERIGIDTSLTALSFTAMIPLTAAGMNSFIITATDADSNKAQRELNFTKLTKETAVEVINPTENLETDQTSVDLQFKVWFDFASYTIVMNTIEIAKKENNTKRPIGTIFIEKLSLSAGFNQIQLNVNGRGGEKIKRIFNVTRRMSGAPSSIASEQKTVKDKTGQPQRWAVVVGISAYSDPTIKNLKYADKDANDFAEFLKTPAGGGFEEGRIKILLNKDATLNNIKLALYNFLRQTVDKDLVVIYFAGHGAPEPANPNNNYLLCYDTDPKSLETTAFPMWDVKTALTRYIPSKRVVVFTDACHSGGISSDIVTRGMKLNDDNLINQYLSDLSNTKEGIIVFTASQAGEVSQELDKFGHGVFTHFLLDGMKGNADFNNDYTVTIGELMDYVEEKVKRQTNGNQHPTRNQGTYDKDLTISVIPH